MNFASQSLNLGRKTKAITSFLGVLGFGASALVSAPNPAQAADKCGGPGVPHWVDTCTAGTDHFSSSDAYLFLSLLDGSYLKLKLTGPATVVRDNPIDAIVGDPVLGNIGIQDGHLGVIRTVLTEKFEGSGLTVIGKGVGAIIEATESGIPRPDLASSFFDVFAEIKGPFGIARNTTPIRVDADRWLQGVPPSVIPGVFPPPPLPVAADPRCDASSPTPYAILYCGFKNVDFFLVDPKTGEFQKENDQLIKVATLEGELHAVNVESVPEPTTMAGILAASIGGAVMKLKKKQRLQA